jgi:hypothetical protein
VVEKLWIKKNVNWKLLDQLNGCKFSKTDPAPRIHLVRHFTRIAELQLPISTVGLQQVFGRGAAEGTDTPEQQTVSLEAVHDM